MKPSKLFLVIGLIAICMILFSQQQSFGQADSSTTAKSAPEEKKPKEKSTWLLYAGVNFSTLSVESDQLDFSSGVGYHVGAAFRSNGFFYYQFGLRYNSPSYTLMPAGAPDTADYTFPVSDLDIPITGGINFLSATNRVLNLRVFLSAVPSFNLGIGDNDFGLNKDSLNSFTFYGQGGVGVDVLFLVIETGYNFGFNDLFADHKSMPGQLFVNLGFRF
ncbi:MAG: hypothetical protein JST18_08285 [Bacteroidetes bacterium]|nr:hypothetical protein [Bacteroidota bacterium]